MKASAETGNNPHIALMLRLATPANPPPQAPAAEAQDPGVPQRNFARLSPYFDEARRARQAASA